jgi:peptidoglycan hydrolase-like protein with peptidoglycan-binding domain
MDPSRDLRTKQYLMLAVIVAVGGAWLAIGATSNDDPTAVSATTAPIVTVAAGDAPATATTIVAGPGVTNAAVTPTSEVGDLVGEEDVPEDCTIAPRTLRTGDTGASVLCLQKALIRESRLVGAASGTFDGPTRTAVIALQTEKSLFVDGEVGRESALALGIWPEEKLNVVRTPPPAPGAKDSMGFPLSSVASTGDDAPPLPPNSGEGRRLVYDRSGQRVWAVDKDGTIIRSWLVSGSQYNNELPGTHKVYSKSEVTTAWNGKAFLKLMVRWMRTEIGAIGFHQIPVRRSDGSVYQTEEELGTRLSGGCQRQAKEDAEFLWKFAKIGTPVIVI